MTRRPIIIDTDPGLDDAIAILLAFASPELDVLGLTAVAGNVGLQRTADNARRLCELAGRREAKVFAGCGRPLLRRQITAVVHGETGLGGADLPPPTMPLQEQHAVDWIVETVMSAPERSITVCALGPLTNLALAFIREPRLPARLRELVIMGGAGPSGGNSTPAAEFNIWFDPEAADIVFRSGVPLWMCGLNLTRQAGLDGAAIDRLEGLNTETARAMAAVLRVYFRNLREGFGASSASLHDPCAVAILLEPSVITWIPMHVAVELRGEHTRGMTVCDARHVRTFNPAAIEGGPPRGTPPNAHVAVGLDHAGFIRLIEDAVAACP